MALERGCTLDSPGNLIHISAGSQHLRSGLDVSGAWPGQGAGVKISPGDANAQEEWSRLEWEGEDADLSCCLGGQLTLGQGQELRSAESGGRRELIPAPTPVEI